RAFLTERSRMPIALQPIVAVAAGEHAHCEGWSFWTVRSTIVSSFWTDRSRFNCYVVLAVLVAACGDDRAPQPDSGSPPPRPVLHTLARAPGATMVAGTRHVALVTDTEWRDSPFTRATPGHAEQLATLRELGG